ncbi:ATP-binding protein (plasmid) [Rhizobium sp. CC1099]|uniref:PAS domain-containing sensor histidine kinase n=1 Tax=Rhizobium sp. CC1099 TaxID=3039160 RepID=UPI0024B0DF88|nr:ATP-binding protein [Rhizobium sp. CC1099]WFU91349.1 ATP-binding protein [Rhizobium sp. CC1099]
MKDTRSETAFRDHVQCVLFVTAAILLSACIFYVDTYTDIEGAVAVLYVVSLLLMAQVAGPSGLVSVAAGCVGLTVLSFGMTHGENGDVQSTLRLIVALSTLFVTTALLLKTERARTALTSMNSALRDSEARYRSIFDSTRVALWERDYSRLYEYLMSLKDQGVVDIKSYSRENPSFIAHCAGLIGVVASNEAAREILGTTSATVGALHQSIVSGEETFMGILQAILDGRRIFESKADAKTDEGEEKRVLLSISFPENPAAFRRIVVTMVDVTQRELTLKALAEAQGELTKASKAAAVGVLSASLAHELNQPLGAISVNSQTLLRWLDRSPPDLPAVRRSAERLIRDSSRASDIIQNARNLLTPLSGKTEDIDLTKLVEETIVLMEHDLQRSNAAVDLDDLQPIPAIPAVKIELQQILINLVTNAIQAMDEHRSSTRVVRIATEYADNDHVAVAVHDTGPGLTEAAKEKLFTPFYTTKSAGMGMGLSICRTMLEARGGTLDADNHIDGGAIFRMRLPIYSDLEHAAAE